jgi:spermidine/putrescine transport system ATP-binding protein
MAMDVLPSVIVRGVSKAFGASPHAVQVLDNVSIEIAEREFFTLLGPSGCGKTTLLRLIAGFEDAQSGEILISGEKVNDLPPFKRNVNTVFQSYALFPHMSVLENVSFGLRMQRLPKHQIRVRANEALELVKMDGFADRRPAQLSGGQQQRVALARALAPRPKVLLLDEPLSALDLKLRKEMQVELKQLQHRAGITFVFVTHDQEEALTLSDRIGVMQAGKILQVGSPSEIYEHPQHAFVASFIGEINLLRGTVNNGKAVLASGGVLDCDVSNLPQGAEISLAIRPERTRLVQADHAATVLKGALSHTAYVGTALVHQVRLDEGVTFLVREATTGAGREPFQLSSRVGISIEPGAVQTMVA